ncbi:hypothetical protein HMPREF0372_04194, partial [Flavonifractor plautii ATCC 29863]
RCPICIVVLHPDAGGDRPAPLDNKKQIGYNSETLGKESRLHERDYSVKTRGAGA